MELLGFMVNLPLTVNETARPLFQSSSMVLYIYQQYMPIPVSSHPRRHFVLTVFLNIAIIVDMKWHLTVVLFAFP